MYRVHSIASCRTPCIREFQQGKDNIFFGCCVDTAKIFHDVVKLPNVISEMFSILRFANISSVHPFRCMNEIDERKCGIDVTRTSIQLLHVYTLAGSLGREGTSIPSVIVYCFGNEVECRFSFCVLSYSSIVPLNFRISFQITSSRRTPIRMNSLCSCHGNLRSRQVESGILSEIRNRSLLRPSFPHDPRVFIYCISADGFRKTTYARFEKLALNNFFQFNYMDAPINCKNE